jgi:hypothetical protein
MGQFISLFELVAVASLCVIIYVLIKTIFQTLKNK